MVILGYLMMIFATTAAGDARWLNSTGDITAGAGIAKDTSTPEVVMSLSVKKLLTLTRLVFLLETIVTVDALGRVTNAISA